MTPSTAPCTATAIGFVFDQPGLISLAEAQKTSSIVYRTVGIPGLRTMEEIEEELTLDNGAQKLRAQLAAVRREYHQGIWV